jgi:hypothetical protein
MGVEDVIRMVEPFLGIEGTKFQLRRLMPGCNGYTTLQQPDTIFLSMTTNRLIETIVHEMVHLAQYKFDGFKEWDDSPVCEWRGQRILFRWKDYLNLPWEREARTKTRYILNALNLNSKSEEQQ